MFEHFGYDPRFDLNCLITTQSQKYEIRLYNIFVSLY